MANYSIGQRPPHQEKRVRLKGQKLRKEGEKKRKKRVSTQHLRSGKHSFFLLVGEENGTAEGSPAEKEGGKKRRSLTTSASTKSFWTTLKRKRIRRPIGSAVRIVKGERRGRRKRHNCLLACVRGIAILSRSGKKKKNDKCISDELGVHPPPPRTKREKSGKKKKKKKRLLETLGRAHKTET